MMIGHGGIDLITIFIGLETMAVSFYILAGFIKPSLRTSGREVFPARRVLARHPAYGMSLIGLSGTTNRA